MRKEWLVNLTLKGGGEDVWNRAKQLVNDLMNLWKCLAEQRNGGVVKRQMLLRSTKDRKIWRAIIVYVVKGQGTKTSTLIRMQKSFGKTLVHLNEYFLSLGNRKF